MKLWYKKNNASRHSLDFVPHSQQTEVVFNWQDVCLLPSRLGNLCLSGPRLEPTVTAVSGNQSLGKTISVTAKAFIFQPTTKEQDIALSQLCTRE